MKYLKAILMTVLILSTGFACADITKYVGAEYQLNFHPQGNSNEKIRTIPQANFISGILLNKNFGVEFGGYLTKHWHIGQSHFQKNGLHFMLVGLHPIHDTLSLSGGIGLCHYMPCLKNKSTDGRLITSRYEQMVPRLMGGFQYKISDCMFLRLHGIWENASALNQDRKIFTDNVHLNAGVSYTL